MANWKVRGQRPGTPSGGMGGMAGGGAKAKVKKQLKKGKGNQS